MEQKKLDRINELARRVRAGETLTAEELAEIIRVLVDNGEETFRLIQEHGDEIEWD